MSNVMDNMSYMFNNNFGGGKSGSPTIHNVIPNLSKRNTGNVTNMSEMFNGYGNTSKNISCMLDLSGRNLSKITGTNGNDVFKFKPITFDVKIPAKTEEKSNEGGNGTTAIEPTLSHRQQTKLSLHLNPRASSW